MIAPLRLPASKSTALPLAWREMRPDPAMRAPGRHVEMTFTGPNRASILSSTACTALRQALARGAFVVGDPRLHSLRPGPQFGAFAGSPRCGRRSRSTAGLRTEVAEKTSATPIAAVESRLIMITPGYVEIFGAAGCGCAHSTFAARSASTAAHSQPPCSRSCAVPGCQLACPSSGLRVVTACDDRAGLGALCHAMW